MTNDSPGVQPTRSQEAQKTSSFQWQQILTGVAAISIVALTVGAAILLSLRDRPGGQPVPPTQELQPTPYVLPATNTPLPPPAAIPTDTPASAGPIEPMFTETSEPPPAEATPTATSTPPPSATPIPTMPVCRPPAGWILYTVQPGDTIVSLAYRFRLSTSQLMQANCLVSPVLYVGQVIYVPSVIVTPTPRPPCGPPPPSWVQYTVRAGDTLYSLAVKTNTTVYAIVQANCLSGYTIYVGQLLWLPFVPPLPTPTFTSVPLTATPTTAIGTPTATSTPGIETPTATATSGPGDTPTPTPISDTPTPTTVPVDTPTATSPPPTATFTSVPPTNTPTSSPPTATSTPPPTNTPVAFPTPTPTSG